MPILLPSGATAFTINDLANEVIIKVENRISDLSRAWVWLKDAILEVAGNPDFRDEFVELEEFGPLYNLIVGTQEYSEFRIVPTGDVNSATLDVLIWIDWPANLQRRQLKYASYQETDKFLANTQSTPSKWYRFGGNLGFYPMPDKTYQIQARILKNHPINYSSLGSTEILLPVDWNLILIYVAVEIGFTELEEYEKANAIHTLLYGDPKYPTRPGMINGRKKKRSKEDWRQVQQLSPVIRRYSHVR
jgi:hypothetical protein